MAEAAHAFFVVGQNASEAVPALIAAFNDPDNGVRVEAMVALRYFDREEGRAALPALLGSYGTIRTGMSVPWPLRPPACLAPWRCGA